MKQVRAMLDAMPAGSEIERRDRAVVAFALLSGARDRAIVSFKLKHIDVENELIEQDAREVKTKRAKTFTTWFFPVGDDFHAIVVDWIAFLRTEKGLRPGRPALSEIQGRARRRSRLSRGRARPCALGECEPRSRDLQGGLRARGPALFQSAFTSEHACATCLRPRA